MNKEKKEQIILIVLIPVFLIGLIYMRSQQASKPAHIVTEAGGHALEPGMEAGESVLIGSGAADIIPAPVSIESSFYKPPASDPFKNLVQLYLYNIQKEAKTKSEPKPKERIMLPLPRLNIEGMIWNTPMPQAIINGRIVRIGDIIEGVKIVKIEKQGITIDYNNELVLIERK
jgi:hypothetical protein